MSALAFLLWMSLVGTWLGMFMLGWWLRGKAERHFF